jgi:hypothetical protein
LQQAILIGPSQKRKIIKKLKKKSIETLEAPQNISLYSQDGNLDCVSFGPI